MLTSTIKLKTFKKIALTTGDPDGIGFEVTVKALVDFAKQNKKFPLFFLFRDANQQKKQPRLFQLIDRNWTRITFYSLETALVFAKTLTVTDIARKKILIDLCLTTSAADWVFEVTHACLQKKLDSVVTAPLSKTLIYKSGYKQVGHTGIFRSFFPKKNLHMGFVGKDFNVMLVTDHISIADVSACLSRKSLAAAYKSARVLQIALNSKKEIAVLGLNPHAGESGIIGKTESRLFKSIKKPFHGPLVPDAAFLRKNWKRFSIFVCMYHDQGLIPFKMHHGQDSGVHVTLGLPFVRTSVDHGTAFDIFNKNMANSASMLDAIYFNLKLLERS